MLVSLGFARSMCKQGDPIQTLVIQSLVAAVFQCQAGKKKRLGSNISAVLNSQPGINVFLVMAELSYDVGIHPVHCLL